MQHQSQTNWCWSAVGTSVGLFFRTGTWTQCSVANGVLGKTNCCTSPEDGCNEYGYLDRSLTYTKSFGSLSEGRCSQDTLIVELNQGHPVCLRCAWTGGGAYFLAICGYDQQTSMVDVADPWYGDSTQNLNTFPSSYHGGGEWTDTYLTAY
jgi:hypothetical protein